MRAGVRGGDSEGGGGRARFEMHPSVYLVCSTSHTLRTIFNKTQQQPPEIISEDKSGGLDDMVCKARRQPFTDGFDSQPNLIS